MMGRHGGSSVLGFLRLFDILFLLRQSFIYCTIVAMDGWFGHGDTELGSEQLDFEWFSLCIVQVATRHEFAFGRNNFVS